MLNKEIENLLSCDNCKLKECISCEITYTDRKKIREYIEQLESKVQQLGKGQHTLMQSRRKWKNRYYKEKKILKEYLAYRQNLNKTIKVFLIEQTERSDYYAKRIIHNEEIGKIMIFTIEDLSKFVKILKKFKGELLMLSKEEIYDKIQRLERDRMGYLEADDRAGARRKEKQIKELETQLDLLRTKEIKEELELYQKFVRKRNLQSDFQSFMIVELASK